MILQQFEMPDAVMPVRRYLHPQSGGRVTFVGMLHAAQPQFFAAVRDLLGELQRAGASVYLEPPMKVSPQQLADTGRTMRKRWLRHRKTLDTALEKGSGLGLV